MLRRVLLQSQCRIASHSAAVQVRGCMHGCWLLSLAHMDTIQTVSAIPSMRVFSTSAEKAAPVEESHKTSLLLEVEDGAGANASALVAAKSD